MVIITTTMTTTTDIAMGTTINSSTQVSAEINAASILSLLHISSPALPVGAFAYSQGLEYALDAGWCKNRDDVQAWLQQNLTYGLGQLDLPIFLRMHRAWLQKQFEVVQHWNETLLAFRETKELYLEDVQVGSAYAQWHLGQCNSQCDGQHSSKCDSEIESEREKIRWRVQVVSEFKKPTVVAMSSLASVCHNIDESTALLGFVWSWCENQIAAASKAMPMGQTDGQTILRNLIPQMVNVCEQAQLIKDDEIGTGLMGLAMASSLHEQQYSRLFRS